MSLLSHHLKILMIQIERIKFSGIMTINIMSRVVKSGIHHNEHQRNAQLRT
jgi:hypothetical protein